jgi:hypothetical protein
MAFGMIFISLAFNGLRGMLKIAGGLGMALRPPELLLIGLSPYGGRSTVITRSPIAIRILVLPFLRWTVMDMPFSFLRDAPPFALVQRGRLNPAFP